MNEDLIENKGVNWKKISNIAGVIITAIVPAILLIAYLAFWIICVFSEGNSDTVGFAAIVGVLAGVVILFVVAIMALPCIGFIISMKKDKIIPFGIICIILTGIGWEILFILIKSFGVETVSALSVISIIIIVAEVIALIAGNHDNKL